MPKRTWCLAKEWVRRGHCQAQPPGWKVTSGRLPSMLWAQKEAWEVKELWAWG